MEPNSLLITGLPKTKPQELKQRTVLVLQGGSVWAGSGIFVLQAYLTVHGVPVTWGSVYRQRFLGHTERKYQIYIERGQRKELVKGSSSQYIFQCIANFDFSAVTWDILWSLFQIWKVFSCLKFKLCFVKIIPLCIFSQKIFKNQFLFCLYATQMSSLPLQTAALFPVPTRQPLAPCAALPPHLSAPFIPPAVGTGVQCRARAGPQTSPHPTATGLWITAL